METSVKYICQGYLSRDPHRTVRVRTVDNKGYITVKGLSTGDIRAEFEYEIPPGNFWTCAFGLYLKNAGI